MQSSVRYLLFFVSLVFATTLYAQSGAQRGMPELMHEEAPLTFDILSFAPLPAVGPDTVRADLYFAVPYSAMEFLRNGSNYVARYSINLTIVDSASGITVLDRFMSYDVREPSVEHESRIEAGQSRADAEQISLPLPAGAAFRIHLIFRDLNSRHERDTVFPFVTKAFRNSKPALSDLMLYRSRRGQRIVPSIGSDVANLGNPDAGVFCEAYNLPADSLLGILAEVLPVEQSDGTPEVLARFTGSVRTPSVQTRTIPIFQNVNFTDLWSGYYRLRFFLLPRVEDTSLAGQSQLAKRAIATSERGITVSGVHGIPLTNANLDEAIEQLRIIATSSEWDSLTSAESTREKREAILEFWRKRNPNESERLDQRSHTNRPMQVFYSRIDYANAHFHAGFQSGWKSDRGRVYIALGPPDVLDRHPYEANQKPYEVWDYSVPMHMRYVFVDSYMLGDYRLTGAAPPQGTFVWQ
ncbi:MAG: GWxTD domain-containing protein [Bacteroidota bacterium]|nr:GWxTD domain-containing protein [Bacteroidota bacterium]MDP4232835.1 GWxTD domain-containing protein [Bacteroidota bacterium]MDP4241879.1 GWxTD domain-containing protein [Bacteroidota bacterium]MDP4288204.1 GWxTD domain-containing protein [Bacteroidota bacterium]